MYKVTVKGHVVALYSFALVALMVYAIVATPSTLARATLALAAFLFAILAASILIPTEPPFDRPADWPPPTAWPAPDPTTRVG
jgi:hypothetical protein